MFQQQGHMLTFYPLIFQRIQNSVNGPAELYNTALSLSLSMKMAFQERVCIFSSRPFLRAKSNCLNPQETIHAIFFRLGLAKLIIFNHQPKLIFNSVCY